METQGSLDLALTVDIMQQTNLILSTTEVKAGGSS